jgi:hypothetical protein
VREEIFGTDPRSPTPTATHPDSDENHDASLGSFLTNLEEQEQAGPNQCADYPDMMSVPRRALPDGDGDGLPDQCEEEIFGPIRSSRTPTATARRRRRGPRRRRAAEPARAGARRRRILLPGRERPDQRDGCGYRSRFPPDRDLERWARAVEGEAVPPDPVDAAPDGVGSRVRRG